ncbi:B12-binding domain-containing radical SAM protein [Oxobacter pfennigii]|uniref:B12-binding domain-containing radical SAM protein n=1 Tax=Oxobacter pfennigii TaxID=36849 RepID=UPI0006D42FD9|nr:radical SAM protein [Oxobacter pfennigii]
MKILLIRPKPHKETIGLQKVMICEPLELEYLGTYIKSYGHEVEILDMILEKKPISFYIEKFNPDVVGLTAYIAHVNIVKEYAREIKQIKNCSVVVGGVHAEVVPEDFDSPFIDYIIKANGIKTFGQIISALQNNLSTENIEGIWGNNLSPIKETTFAYPHPDRSLVKKYRDKYYYMFHNPCALMKTSFGCPYNCSFCFCRKITDGKYFFRNIKDIIDELKNIPEDEIYIVDDDFLVDRDRLLEFCNALDEQNIKKKYLIYGRADFIAKNEDVIKRFQASGLRAVIVGLESGREEELLKYNKKSSVEINETAVSILNKYNIECYGTFIIGIDYEKKDFSNLYIWIKKLNIKFINLQPFTPLPGTELYDDYKDTLIISRDQFEKWDLAHTVVKPVKMDIRSYYFNILKIYYKITMNPVNILKMIKKYGIKECFKLSLGTSSITMQYIKKSLQKEIR